MTTQVQVRGNITATQAARTLASRELDVDTTKKRINIHDGSTVGGIPHANYQDVQNQTFTAATATGTNAIVVTLPNAPAAYANLQKFAFKAANTITGSSTLNINALGAKTIMKLVSGALTTLAAGDIVAGMIYECAYDGTQMILLNVSGGASGSLVLLGSQTASASATLDFASLITSAYDVYEFDIQTLLPASNNKNLLVSYSTNNGGAYSATTAYAGMKSTPSAVSYDGTSIATGTDGGAGSAIDGRVLIYNPLNAARHKRFTYATQFILNSGANDANQSGGGRFGTTAAVNAVRFAMDSGNLTSGVIRMFGRKNS